VTTKRELGKIITFYSYKGGTGRSMGLANIAWILASNGQRVLMIDWDLEAPGLHRYFRPFLLDPELSSTEGLMDFITEYVVEAMTPPVKGKSANGDSYTAQWYEPYADITHYAVSVDGSFPSDGALDLVAAGRQDHSYATRVNSFNWQDFYERLGGGGFFELAKDKMRTAYDYILIDSRTGVSDTAGICTVQMPDLLAICFTYNIQSIEGAAAVAESVLDNPQRSAMHIFPIPMRAELAEKDKLEMARTYARQRFDRLLSHIDVRERESYWGGVEILYQAFYAYEELLATFGDRPKQPNSVLAGLERITGYLTRGSITALVPPLPDERDDILAEYARHPRAPSRPPFPSVASHRTGPFISYSPVDGEDFVLRLTDALLVEPNSMPVWLDRQQLSPGQDSKAEVDEAIQSCETFLFVITRDSVSNDSVKEEWTLALKYRKPIIPLRVDRDAEMPFDFGNRNYIDFTEDFDVGLATLRQYLEWLATPEGKLRNLRDRLRATEHDLRRADPVQRTRIEDETVALRSQIALQQRDVEHQGAETRLAAVDRRLIETQVQVVDFYRHQGLDLANANEYEEAVEQLDLAVRNGLSALKALSRQLEKTDSEGERRTSSA
jgi:hypothetical protein